MGLIVYHCIYLCSLCPISVDQISQHGDYMYICVVVININNPH